MADDSLPVRGGIAANGKTSFTSAQAAAQLTRSNARWSADAGGGSTVTYAFRESGTVPVDGGATFYTFNADQIAATELALSSWSDVANIRFVRVGAGYSNDASILFGNFQMTDPPGAAFATGPGSRASNSRSGDVWVSTTQPYNVRPVVGEYGQQVLVHEIGHALGLSHPSVYDATDETDPTYATNAAYYEDARQYTIMSYFASSNTGANLGAFAAAPQIDDIAAVQRLYGANYATRAGNTVYGFNATADRAYYSAAGDRALVFAVWDGGGRDTFDFSGYADDQLIDLRQGAFSDVGGWRHNVSIAVGVTIEEAIGGSGADRLIANDAGNDLIGGGGADVLGGGAGNDHLYGGGRVAVAGDGADTLNGGAGGDYLQGNGGNDVLAGDDGSDRIFGGQGDDRIDGGAGNDTVNGNLGNDAIGGGQGNDLLRGGQGDDVLDGSDGNDVLLGDLGNDVLQGNGGIDLMTGGAGADRFLVTNSGIDLATGQSDAVTDWEDGVDRLFQYRGTTVGVAYVAGSTLGELVDAARAALNGLQGAWAVAAGLAGDTFVFTRYSDASPLDAVRLLGVADPRTITVADFG